MAKPSNVWGSTSEAMGIIEMALAVNHFCDSPIEGGGH